METIKTAYNQVASNKFKTVLIMVIFTVFVVGVAFLLPYALGYTPEQAFSFSIVLLIIALIMNFASYYFSDSIILAISKAIPVTKADNRQLYNLVENLCIADGLPVPKIYIIPDSAPNAFATGRDPQHASIVFTQGILEKLNKQELEGVAAHELSHVKNYDIRVMAVVTVLVGLVALLSDLFFRMMFFGRGRDDRDENNGNLALILFVIAIILAILSPIIAQLIQLAVSRRREYLADASGAVLTRNPDALAEALIKISNDPEPLEVANKGTAHLYIENPFKEDHKGGVSWFANLFNTHPPIADRVAALRSMQ